MSRVAKNPIEIADGVTVNFNDGCLDVKGKVGELKFDLPETVSLDIADNVQLSQEPDVPDRSHSKLFRKNSLT